MRSGDGQSWTDTPICAVGVIGLLLIGEGLPGAWRPAVHAVIGSVTWLLIALQSKRGYVGPMAVVLLLAHQWAVGGGSMAGRFAGALDLGLWCGPILYLYRAARGMAHRHRVMAARLLVLVVIVTAIVGLVLDTGRGPEGIERTWPLVNPNHMAILMVALLPLLFSSSFGDGRLWLAIRSGAALVLIFLVIDFRSLGAMGALAVFLLFAALPQSRRTRYGGLLALLWLAPPVAVLLSRSIYEGAARRAMIWQDVLTGIEPLRWLSGYGWMRFTWDYPVWQSWHPNLGQVVLAPESELIMLLYGAGIWGALAAIAGAVWWIAAARDNRGGLRRAGLLGLWAIVFQATADNSLHTLPMLGVTALLAGWAGNGRDPVREIRTISPRCPRRRQASAR